MSAGRAGRRLILLVDLLPITMHLLVRLLVLLVLLRSSCLLTAQGLAYVERPENLERYWALQKRGFTPGPARPRPKRSTRCRWPAHCEPESSAGGS